MNKQRMRIGPHPVKLEWRTMAISAKDPLVFARELQSALQELTDSGFTIASQMQRAEGLIIVASCVRESAPEATPEMRMPSMQRRRVVEMPHARAQGATTEEVLYHFIDARRGQKQRSFPTLIEALREVKKDLEAKKDAGPEILPINITTISMTRFEPESFTLLLKMFAEDLQCPPG